MQFRLAARAVGLPLRTLDAQAESTMPTSHLKALRDAPGCACRAA